MFVWRPYINGVPYYGFVHFYDFFLYMRRDWCHRMFGALSAPVP